MPKKAFGGVVDWLPPSEIDFKPAKKTRGMLFPAPSADLTATEMQMCVYGFLMACNWPEDEAPPTEEYKEALAGLYRVRVPSMDNYDDRGEEL